MWRKKSEKILLRGYQHVRPHFCERHITDQMLSTTFDPDNRLVAGELEARWNAALSTVGEVEQRLRDNELPANVSRIPDKETLCSLAQDLPAFN